MNLTGPSVIAHHTLMPSMPPGLVAYWDARLNYTEVAIAPIDPNAIELWADLSVGQSPVTPNTLDVLDPLGGNTADKVDDTLANDYHGRYQPVAPTLIWPNAEVGPTIFEAYYQSPTRNFRFFSDGGPVTSLATYTSGGVATVISGGGTATMVPAPNGWWKCQRYRQNMWSDTGALRRMFMGPCIGITDVYVGTGVNPIYLWGARAIQHRCSAMAGQLGTAFNMAAAAPANQPFLRRGNGSSPGEPATMRPDIWEPNGIGRNLGCISGFGGVFDGVDTPMTLLMKVQAVIAAPAAGFLSFLLNSLGGGLLSLYTTGVGTVIGRRHVGFYKDTAAIAFGDTNPHVWSLVFDGVNMVLRRDLVAGAPANGAFGVAPATVGAFIDTNQTAVQAVGLYDRALSDSEIRQAVAYMGRSP